MRVFRLGLGVASAALFLAGCSASAGLSAPGRARLDSLDATGVVRAYFESGSQATELYLPPPEEREQSKYMRDNERGGGVRNLLIEGGEVVAPTIAGAERYTDQRQFTVAYTSRRANVTGEPAGKRFYFVYVGRSPDNGSWKVIGVGTGP